MTQPDLPYARHGSMHSRHASYSGARAAAPLAGSQADRILRFLREAGPRTYHDIADIKALPLATVCARMNWLAQRGLVRSCGVVQGPHGAKREVWETT